MKFGSRKICVVCAVVLSTTFVCKANVMYSFKIFNNTFWASDSRLNFALTISNEGFTDAGRQKAGFRFDNNSTIISSITDIYFDAYFEGGSLDYKNAEIINGPGVVFSKGASPKTLPGGRELTPKFDKYPEYSTDSDSPVSPKGINPDEWLKLVFLLKTGKTYDDLITEIAAGGSITEENLRIGIHIQALPNCNSVSAINRTIAIPELATVCILSLCALSLIGRKKR